MAAALRPSLSAGRIARVLAGACVAVALLGPWRSAPAAAQVPDDSPRTARVERATNDLRSIASAVFMHLAHMGALPTTLHELTVPLTNAQGRTAGPLLPALPGPPTGWKPYSYTRGPNATFSVESEGDGIDVCVPKKCGRGERI